MGGGRTICPLRHSKVSPWIRKPNGVPRAFRSSKFSQSNVKEAIHLRLFATAAVGDRFSPFVPYRAKQSWTFRHHDAICLPFALFPPLPFLPLRIQLSNPSTPLFHQAFSSAEPVRNRGSTLVVRPCHTPSFLPSLPFFALFCCLPHSGVVSFHTFFALLLPRRFFSRGDSE